MTIHEHLKNIGACKDAKKWALQFNTAQEVWDNNKKIDWLFWWAVRCGQAMNVVMAAREIANSVQHIKNENSTAAYYAYAAAAATDAASAAVTNYAADYAAASASDAAAAATAAAYATAAYYAADYAANSADYDAAYAAAADAATAATDAATAVTYYAATAAADAADAAYCAAAEQKELNMQIAKKHCHLPWSETEEKQNA